MAPRIMTMDEIIIRQSIEVLQSTIEELCRKRDALAAALPDAPRPRMVTHICGREIKQGGGKRGKKQQVEAK